MERGNYRRGGNRGRGQGQGRSGGGRGGPQTFQPRASDQYQFRGAPYNQPGRGGATAWPRPPPQQQASGGGVDTAWVRPPPQQHGGGNEQQQVVDPPPPLPQSYDDVPVDLGSLNITEQSLSSAPKSYKEKLVPVARPDDEKITVKSIELLANHFPVTFNPQTTIMHYDVDIQHSAGENRPVKKLINKSDLRMITEKLCADDPTRFPMDKTAYHGKKSIFSAVQLPTGCFTVNWSNGDDAMGRSYDVTIKLVAELKLCKLKEYLSGDPSYIPPDLLQGMDVVMKENPSRCRTSVGRCFYSNEHLADHDFRFGVAAYQGFQQSLKPTPGGLALCLDYSRSGNQCQC